jgi:hypothetical protein
MVIGNGRHKLATAVGLNKRSYAWLPVAEPLPTR